MLQLLAKFRDPQLPGQGGSGKSKQGSNSGSGLVGCYQVPIRTTAWVEILNPSCGWIWPTSFIHE